MSLMLYPELNLCSPALYPACLLHLWKTLIAVVTLLGSTRIFSVLEYLSHAAHMLTSHINLRWIFSWRCCCIVLWNMLWYLRARVPGPIFHSLVTILWYSVLCIEEPSLCRYLFLYKQTCIQGWIPLYKLRQLRSYSFKNLCFMVKKITLMGRG